MKLLRGWLSGWWRGFLRPIRWTWMATRMVVLFAVMLPICAALFWLPTEHRAHDRVEALGDLLTRALKLEAYFS